MLSYWHIFAVVISLVVGFVAINPSSSLFSKKGKSPMFLFGAAKAHADPSKTSIFDYEVENIEGTNISLSSYRGKSAYLVVNVASE